MSPEITPEMEAIIAKSIMENRPHLYELERHINEIPHGQLEVVLDIRGGRVEKMTFVERKSWIREKQV